MNYSLKFKLRNNARPDGTYPVVLQIIKDRKKREVYTGYYCTENQFDGQEFTTAYGKNKSKANQNLLNIKRKAHDIIEDIRHCDDNNFSLDDFVNAFKSKPKSGLVLDFFLEIIEERKLANQIGTAKTENDTLNAMKRMPGFSKMIFAELNYEWLKKFEAQLRSRNNTNGGIALKMRSIRTVTNRAVKSGLMKSTKYPFKDYKISALKSTPTKRALTIEQFKAIRGLNLKDHMHLLETKLLFLFSFYCRGMNFADLILLEWKNIDSNVLEYSRQKTGTKFKFELLGEAQIILDHFKEGRVNKYVFPLLLHENLTAQQIFNRKHKTLTKYNQNLKEIASLAGITVPLTSYVSRHSYATILKFIGTSSDIISQSMGHSSLDVTNAYLKSFDNKTLDDANSKLSEL